MNQMMCKRLEDYLKNSYGCAANHLSIILENDLEKGILEGVRRYAILVKKNHTQGYQSLIEQYQSEVLNQLPDKQMFTETDYVHLEHSLDILMNQINCLVW